MRELAFNEYCSVSGGEVGATKMGDDVSYTGVYPHCAIAGVLAEVSVSVALEAMGPAGQLAEATLNVSQAASDKVVHNCTMTHGDPLPSLPPAAGGGGDLHAAFGYDFLLKVKDFH
jgi:hypothetical protein